MTTPKHLPQSPPIAADLVERDDGQFQIGIGDDAPAFPTRLFAVAVAAAKERPKPQDTPNRKIIFIRR